MGIFGWTYPAGCNGPPEEPDAPPQSFEVYDLLEAAGCDQDVIDKACKLVEQAYYGGMKDAECPVCLERAMKDCGLVADKEPTEKEGSHDDTDP